MKVSIRSGVAAAWLFAGALLASGIYATRTAGAQQAPAGDSAAVMSPVQQQAADSAPIVPSGPPATGAGGAAAPIDTAGAIPQARSVRTLADVDTPIHQRLVSVLGMVALLFFGWLLSVNRALIPWRIVVWGLGLQIVFALLILRTPAGEAF